MESAAILETDMHTREIGSTLFHFNADLSGAVMIVKRDKGKSFESLEVPGEDLIRFIAEWVANQKISELEDMEPHEVLGLKRESLP